MIDNRSMPASAVIPVLSYPDVEKASRWLCEAFGFEARLMIGTHRAQLGFGDGAVVVTELKGGERIEARTDKPFAVMVRVEDAKQPVQAVAVATGRATLPGWSE